MDCWWCIYSDTNRKKGEGEHEHLHTPMHPDMEESDSIPREKMLEALDDFSDMGVKAVTYSGGGEPLFYKHIVEVMQRTLDLGIDLSIITNGELLFGKKAEILADAKWVRVSIDYTNEDEMIRFRRVGKGSYARVINNLSNFSEIKNSNCDLAVNYIVHRDNCDNLLSFANDMKAYGVENIRFSPMWTSDFYDYHNPIVDKVNKQLSKISEIADNKFTVNSTYMLGEHKDARDYPRCFYTEIVPVVGADQNIYTCHNKAYDSSGCIGSIQNRSFKDVWMSSQGFFDKFDPRIRCSNHQCANDSKNIILQELVGASFDNFI
jgi:sulfatase maturation enzyme AslB (radical SAM superfamily)